MTDEPDRYLGEKDLVHHPQGRRAMTAADLAAMHTRHANALPIPSGTVLGHEHLMAHADRGTLLAELNREMERTRTAEKDRDGLRELLRATAVKEGDAYARAERLEAEVERLNLEVVQNASGAQVIMTAGLAYMEEVKRLEKAVAALKEVNDRLLAERERLYAERAKIVPWIRAQLEMYPLDSYEAEAVKQIAADLEEEMASGFQEGIAEPPAT